MNWIACVCVVFWSYCPPEKRCAFQFFLDAEVASIEKHPFLFSCSSPCIINACEFSLPCYMNCIALSRDSKLIYHDFKTVSSWCVNRYWVNIHVHRISSHFIVQNLCYVFDNFSVLDTREACSNRKGLVKRSKKCDLGWDWLSIKAFWETALSFLPIYVLPQSFLSIHPYFYGSGLLGVTTKYQVKIVREKWGSWSCLLLFYSFMFFGNLIMT